MVELLQDAAEPTDGLNNRLAYVLGWTFTGLLGAYPGDHDEWDILCDIAGCWVKPGDVEPDILNKAEYRGGQAAGRWDAPPFWLGSVEEALGLLGNRLTLSSPEMKVGDYTYDIMRTFPGVHRVRLYRAGIAEPAATGQHDYNLSMAVVIALLNELARGRHEPV